MTLLFAGLLLLVAVLGIGRDARLLAWHGLATALCLLSSGAHLAALLAAGAALSGGVGFSVGLRVFEQPVQGTTAVRRAGAVGLLAVGLAAFSETAGRSGTDVDVLAACGFAVLLAGIYAALLAPGVLEQAISVVCALDGVLVLAGVAGSIPAVVIAVVLEVCLAVLTALVLRRLVWSAHD
ncbi:hypothetical protein AA103196_1024 [Ameyamaea chiangmaiensis NBRC 103196]|uniref:Uncharacterized protein n=1 Tax=Ameyamaea chiangmaiensis TaxID=442969 RepID=A0A850PDQ8_9PROT|nr:hypothetical protein [Ameyamaea chiangmaiensis]MBS4074650.1 hypothetical protein [Ameyamaea chiangmaiensis]NVN42148.1 hypothetical protein [Ameyamaea chiangmaiensis]GBQ64984.1 hypothetical protein AA103196_1024 [Ameyamaea chiangmaiensis NBRC 103196]